MTRRTAKNQQLRIEHSRGTLREGKKNTETVTIGQIHAEVEQDYSYECCVSVSLSRLEPFDSQPIHKINDFV